MVVTFERSRVFLVFGNLEIFRVRSLRYLVPINRPIIPCFELAQDQLKLVRKQTPRPRAE